MVLVTGGTGAVGSELLRLLSQAGVATRALTRNPRKRRMCPASHGSAAIWPNQKR